MRWFKITSYDEEVLTVAIDYCKKHGLYVRKILSYIEVYCTSDEYENLVTYTILYFITLSSYRSDLDSPD